MIDNNMLYYAENLKSIADGYRNLMEYEKAFIYYNRALFLNPFCKESIRNISMLCEFLLRDYRKAYRYRDRYKRLGGCDG